jgi:hypothetical protein
MKAKAASFLRTAAMLTAVALSPCIHAQPAEDVRLRAATEAAQSWFAPPTYNLWGGVTFGDLTGDGVDDAAMIFTVRVPSQMWLDDKLVVLRGSKSGAWTVLSASAAFCGARYGYEKEIKRGSLYVQSLHSLDARRMSTSTMRLRFNPRLRDLEVIGNEEWGFDNESGDTYQSSINYLTGAAVQYRIKGKRRKQIKERLPRAPLARLNGFNCAEHPLPRGKLYLNEDFSVDKKP